MSRRLKHLREEHTFFIKSSGSSDTEHKIISLVDGYVMIHQKYIAKGHTKETEIKQIEKHLKVTPKDGGMSFNLSVHVSHYTNLYFSVYEYIAKLNSELGLPPASIMYNVSEIITKDNTRKISQPIDIPQVGSMFL